MYWTKEVIDAITNGGSSGLLTYANKCTQQLNRIVSLVRGQLTTLERATCGALVTIDVHARDVSSCKLFFCRTRLFLCLESSAEGYKASP